MTMCWGRGVAVAAGVVVTLAGAGARAASEVDVGGFHEQVIETARQDLLTPKPSSPAANLGTQLEVRSNPARGSALTAFTPRFGGLGLAISGRQHSRASLLADGESAEAHRLQIGLRDSAEIAGWDVGLAATADMGRSGTAGDGGSALMVGGQLAVSGLRFDAAVGRDSSFLGEDGRRVTAGVGYEFGPLDTHMSYSLVESEERATETGLLSLASQLELSSNLVLKGDLAIAEEDDGTATTAGRVSLRLNF